MATYRTSAEWAGLVEAYKKSGQTMTAWCKEQGVNAKTLGPHVHGKKTEKKARGAQEWAVLIEQQKASGISRAAWCQEHGINTHTMATAESRIKAREAPPASEKLEWIELAPAPAPEESGAEEKAASIKQKERTPGREAAPPEQEEFAPKRDTNVTAKEERHGKIEIRVSGVEIEADTDYPVEQLAALLGKLVKVC